MATNHAESSHGAVRARREPPPFRRLVVHSIDYPTRHTVGVTLAGPELEGLTVEQPAASVRLLLPPPGRRELIMPSWNGNEFLLPDGARPTLRTFTPRRVRPIERELDLEIVIHDGGASSEWATKTVLGDPAAISGPGRGYAIDRGAPAFLLAGDETAIPAISQLLEALPTRTPVLVRIEVARPEARRALPEHPRAVVEWCDLPPGSPPGDALVSAVGSADLDPGTRVWAAGEAGAMQRMRRHLFEDRGLPRAQTSVRGYWKHGRSGDSADAGAL